MVTSYKIAKSTICLLLALFTLGSPKAEAVDDPALEPFFIASASYNRKLYPVAVDQFKKFLQSNESHPKADLARRGLALSLYALKLYDKAIPEFATLLAKPNLDKEIDRERLIAAPDCGLGLLGRDLARVKLKNLSQAAHSIA